MSDRRALAIRVRFRMSSRLGTADNVLKRAIPKSWQAWKKLLLGPLVTLVARLFGPRRA